MQQIDYYRDSHGFEKKEDLLRIYECMHEVINHVEQLATVGKKYPLFLNENWGGARYTLYNNEVFAGDNTILIDTGDFKIAYINHSLVNYMTTRNIEFCNHIYQSIQNTMQRSLQISSTGEKEWVRFFNQMRQNINRRMEIGKAMNY